MEGGGVRSRRALLFGGLAAVSAAVSGSIARARPAGAANGDPIAIGEANDGASATTLESPVVQDATFTGIATGDGSVGVAGQTSATTGEPAGLFGYAVAGSGLSHGVFGRSESTIGVGVTGRSTSPTGTGIGVAGRATSPTGVGVHAQGGLDGTGIAFRAFGQVRFSTSGIATIARGSKQVTVNPHVPITTASAIHCTLLGNPGAGSTIHRVARNYTADVFTIWLTANASAATKVAWFLIAGS
jgi:hypothetical protein